MRERVVHKSRTREVMRVSEDLVDWSRESRVLRERSNAAVGFDHAEGDLESHRTVWWREWRPGCGGGGGQSMAAELLAPKGTGGSGESAKTIKEGVLDVGESYAELRD